MARGKFWLQEPCSPIITASQPAVPRCCCPAAHRPSIWLQVAFGHCENVAATWLAGKEAPQQVGVQRHALSPAPGGDMAKKCPAL